MTSKLNLCDILNRLREGEPITLDEQQLVGKYVTAMEVIIGRRRDGVALGMDIRYRVESDTFDELYK
jgi:hypothetical protein